MFNRNWIRVGETEVVTDNLNPKFVQSVVINYCFEVRQLVKAKVFDVDNFKPGSDVAQNVIGEVHFYAHEIVKAHNQTLILPILNEKANKNLGNLQIIAEEKKRGSKLSYRMKIKLTGYESYKKLFYRLSRFKESNDTNKEECKVNYVPIYESETCTVDSAIREYLFKTCELWGYALNRDIPTNKIQVTFYQFKTNGQHQIVSTAYFFLEDIVKQRTVRFVNNKSEEGAIEFVISEAKERFTFMDYVFSGLEISLVIAIDFTGSNGDPNEPNSKHYYDFGKLLISYQSIHPSNHCSGQNT